MKKRVIAGILFAITLFAVIYGISTLIAMPHQFSIVHSSSWIQPTAFSTLGIHPMGDEGGGGRPFSNSEP